MTVVGNTLKVTFLWFGQKVAMRQSEGSTVIARKLVHNLATGSDKKSASQRNTCWCIAFGPSHLWLSRLKSSLYTTRLEYCGTCMAIG